MFQIRGCIKEYHWGKFGLKSAVATLQKSAFNDFEAKDSVPYAEMWLGTHKSGPATIPSLNELKLDEWIRTHPESLGRNIIDLYGSENGLPFLFKVLSVNYALSIQAHPDKEMAKILRRDFPDHYPDDNHKPEMAIALTQFEALCGFRPVEEIKTYLECLSQLRAVIGEETVNNFLKKKVDIKTIFSKLMTCKMEVFQQQLTDLVQNFKCNTYNNELCKSIRDLFIRIEMQYPGDIGCFCLFFLNYIKLKPSEALFLAANEPHAYLYGDCIECMACSDNVVRAGLTPKFKDVATLCNILTYNCKPGDKNLFFSKTDSSCAYTTIYDPPVNEFSVDKIEVKEMNCSFQLKRVDTASILLVLKGSGKFNLGDEVNLPFITGAAFFISCNMCVQVQNDSELVMFIAYCNG